MIGREQAVRSALAARRKVSPEKISMRSICFVISSNTGISPVNVFKWIASKEKLLTAFSEKKAARRAKRLGTPGRPPAFPKAEEAVGTEVRVRRLKNFIVTKKWMLSAVKKEAAKENSEKAQKAKFTVDYLLDVLRRQGLALRLPSCTKAMSLENGILAGRGWLVWLRKLIRDEWPDGLKYGLKMHSEQGRFLFRCRVNKDEVRIFIVCEMYPPQYASRCRCSSALPAGPSQSVENAPPMCDRLQVGGLASVLWCSCSRLMALW